MKTIILKLKLWIIHVIECYTMRQNRGYIVVFANTDRYEYPTTEIHVCKSYYQATKILKGEEETLKNEIKPQEYDEIYDWFGVTDKYGNQTTGEIFSIEMLLNRSINKKRKGEQEMPNWCNTVYACIGEPKEIRQLHNAIKINARRKTSRVKNGFGTLWLGNIIDQLGGNWEEWKCRGEITGFKMEKNAKKLTIYQSTAWCEQEGFRKFIEQKFPSIKVYYLDIEPGCQWYGTNDKTGECFPERYYLDSYEGTEMFNTIEEAAEYVSGIVNQKVETNMKAIEQALDNYEEEHEDDDVFYSFHQIQVVED